MQLAAAPASFLSQSQDSLGKEVEAPATFPSAFCSESLGLHPSFPPGQGLFSVKLCQRELAGVQGALAASPSGRLPPGCGTTACSPPQGLP